MKKLFLLLAFTGIVGAASATSIASINNTSVITLGGEEKKGDDKKKKEEKACCKKEGSAKACSGEAKGAEAKACSGEANKALEISYPKITNGVPELDSDSLKNLPFSIFTPSILSNSSVVGVTLTSLTAFSSNFIISFLVKTL